MPILAGAADEPLEPLDQSMRTTVTLSEYWAAKAAANARGITREELLREALIRHLRETSA